MFRRMPRSQAKGKHAYDAATKAAVMAALLAGQSVSQVAKTYKLPKGTVSAWKKRNAAGSQRVASGATQKSQAIGDLLYELVRENLKGLIAGAALLQDRDWLKQQGAAELGTILGITNDKTVRMLEALGGSTETPAAA